MVMNLNGALERRIFYQAKGLRLGINPIGLANEGHVTGLFGFGAPSDFIDIRHAEPGYLNLFNVPDLEVAMQRRSGLIITVGLQLYLTLFA
ncbi:hypothetical protein D3C80_1164780 [compost metagenome]